MAGKLLKETKKEEKIRKIEDEDEEIDDIFGNVNKWLKDAEEEIIENKTKRKLTKIEDGIKSSKKTKTEKAKKEKAVETKKIEVEAEKEKTTKTKKATKTSKKATTQTRKRAQKQEIEKIEEQPVEEELIDEQTTKPVIQVEKQEQIETPSEIKIHTENNLTEIILKKNRYKIELQKTEYNIYTDTNETSYVIVRDPILRIISGEVYINIEKQEETYEITTNQDFKINYVIDNLERKNNEVNFKLTNLTEIYAYEDGIIFEIDEEKVIENNLEDNKTLVISEEEGKVYLPYTKEDIKNEVMQNKGTKITDVIEDKYILPIEKYKNSIRARFREGYNLMYKREGKSKKSAIMLGIELMFETNLHPAIISACKNLEELDIYLDCLEDNELEKFSCFKIIYKSLPTIRKKAKYQEL